MNPKVLSDADGTLLESTIENYNRIREAWKSLYRKDYPFTYDQFLSFRPYAKSVEDFFSLSLILQSNNGSFPDDFLGTNKVLRESDDVKNGKEIFYEKRRYSIKKNKDLWLSETTIHNGVPEMLSRLKGEDIGIIVVTSKNYDSVFELMDYHEILKYIDKILDKEIGGKEAQFRKLFYDGDVEENNCIVYDDLVSNLEIAKFISKSTDTNIIPVLALQGHESEENINNCSFEKAWPREFPILVEKLLLKRD
jgi:phosphoglycolate phosphatase-like HAD superfamily hydrolase